MIAHSTIAFVEHWEGFRSRPYRDGAGWSIGFGFWTRRMPRHAMTRAEAEDIMARRLNAIQRAITTRSGRSLTQGQLTALDDFAYNLGLNALFGSKLWKYVRQGALVQADGQFGRWVYCRGKPLPGLIKRRQAEARKFIQK